MRIPRVLSVTLAAALALGLAGCGASSNFAADTGEAQASTGYAAPSQSKTAAIEEAGYGANDTVKEETDADRKLIRTVQLTVETTDFDAVTAEISAKCSELGGYISSREVWGSAESTSRRWASYVVRIPAAKCDTFIENTEAVGNVTGHSEQMEDITVQYVDTAARIESLRTEQARLNELLAQAANLDDLIKLEDRLSDVRAELASYEQTQRIYDNQVDYATVRLELSEVKNLTVTQPSFLDDLKDAFSGSLESLGSFVRSIILTAVFLWWFWLALAVAVWLLFKMRKKRSAKKAAPPPAPSQMKDETP